MLPASAAAVAASAATASGGGAAIRQLLRRTARPRLNTPPAVAAVACVGGVGVQLRTVCFIAPVRELLLRLLLLAKGPMVRNGTSQESTLCAESSWGIQNPYSCKAGHQEHLDRSRWHCRLHVLVMRCSTMINLAGIAGCTSWSCDVAGGKGQDVTCI